MCSDIDATYDLSAEIVRLNLRMIQLAATHPQGQKTFTSGRVVLLYDRHFSGNLGIVLRPAAVDASSSGDLRSYWVFALTSPATKAGAQDIESLTAPPIWPATISDHSGVEMTYEILTVDTSSFSLVLNRTVPQLDVTGILDKNSQEACDKASTSLQEVKDQLLQSPTLPEVEWTRMRSSLDFQEMLRNRGALAARASTLQSRSCPEFESHVSPATGRKI